MELAVFLATLPWILLAMAVFAISNRLRQGQARVDQVVERLSARIDQIVTRVNELTSDVADHEMLHAD